MLHILGPERQRSVSLEGPCSGMSPLTCWGLDGSGTQHGRGSSLPARTQAVPPGAGRLRPLLLPRMPTLPVLCIPSGSGGAGGRQAASATSTGHHFEPRRHSGGGVHSESPRLSPPGAERVKGTSGAQMGGELTTVVASGRLPCDAPVREAEAGSRGPQVPSVLRVACGRWAPAARGEVLGALPQGPCRRAAFEGGPWWHLLSAVPPRRRGRGPGGRVLFLDWGLAGGEDSPVASASRPPVYGPHQRPTCRPGSSHPLPG